MKRGTIQTGRYLAISLLIVLAALTGYLTVLKKSPTIFASVESRLYPGINKSVSSSTTQMRAPFVSPNISSVPPSVETQNAVEIGNFALVLGAFGNLVKVSLNTQRVVSRVDTYAYPAQNPDVLSYSPVSKLAVVLSLNSPKIGNAAVIINTLDMRIIKTVQLPFNPVSVAIDPTTGYAAYITGASGELALLNLTNFQIEKQIQLISNQYAYLDAIAVTPNGQTAIVLDDGGQQAGNIAILVDLKKFVAYYKVILTNDPGAFLDSCAITPDGKYAWVINGGYGNGFTQSIELPQGVVSQPIAVGGGPLAIVIDGKTQTAYVINGATGNGNLIVPVDINPNLTTPQPTGGTPIQVDPNVNLYLDDGFVIPSTNTLWVLDRDSGNLIPVNLSTDVPGNAIKATQFPVAAVLI